MRKPTKQELEIINSAKPINEKEEAQKRYFDYMEIKEWNSRFREECKKSHLGAFDLIFDITYLIAIFGMIIAFITAIARPELFWMVNALFKTF